METVLKDIINHLLSDLDTIEYRENEIIVTKRKLLEFGMKNSIKVFKLRED